MGAENVVGGNIEPEQIEPSEEEKKSIDRLMEQSQFTRIQAEIKVLGESRAAAWRELLQSRSAAGEVALEGVEQARAMIEGSQQPVSTQEVPAPNPKKIDKARMAQLARGALSNGGKAFLEQQPPSLERDMLIKGYEDSEAA